MFKVVAFLTIVFSANADGVEYTDYYDQENWGESCNENEGYQSPIEIESADYTVHYQTPFPDMGTVENVTHVNPNDTGAYIKFLVPDDHDLIHMPDNWPVGHTNGLQALQLHFHWGEDNLSGAEHILFGGRHAGEIHLVTRNLDQDDESAHDYYAVFGVMIDEVDEDDASMPEDVDARRLIAEMALPLSTLNGTLTLSTLFPLGTDTIYTYEGSLTTPGCNEIVFWQLLESPLFISNFIYNADGMTALERIQSYTQQQQHVDKTHRDVQDLNGRKITQRLLDQPYDDSDYEGEDNNTEDVEDSIHDDNADWCDFDYDLMLYRCYYGAVGGAPGSYPALLVLAALSYMMLV